MPDDPILTPHDRDILMEHEWAVLVQQRWPKGTRRRGDHPRVDAPTPPPVTGGYRLMALHSDYGRLAAAARFSSRDLDGIWRYLARCRRRRTSGGRRWIERDGQPARVFRKPGRRFGAEWHRCRPVS